MTPDEITPEESVAPVYLDPAPAPPESEVFVPTPDAVDPVLESALDKLMRLGLTRDEALALARGGAS